LGRNKKYSGYKAYQYLEPGKDYVQIKFRDEIVKEWSYTLPLSKTEEERFEDIMEKSVIVDLHEHPVAYPQDIFADRRNEGRQFMAYEALGKSGLDCIFDNMMDGSSDITSKNAWKWTDVIHDLGMRLCDIAHQDFVIHCKTVDDIMLAHKAGKLAWVAVLESLSCIENEVDRIDILFGLGVRSAGVTYSESNMLGSGLRERNDGGLTDLGYDTIVRMNKVGMLIDVSHSSDKTAMDTIESSKKPIIISHCGSRTLTPSKRMKPDGVLKALAEREGLLGVEMAGAVVKTKKNPVSNLEAYMEQVEYCIKLLGIDHVGCGPDTLYGDHIGLYRSMATKNKTEGFGRYSRDAKPSDKVLGMDMDVSTLPDYVKGMENPTECLENVVRWMTKHGYSDSEIKKVVGENALQLLRKVW
jgi:membrane dipeptidase